MVDALVSLVVEELGALVKDEVGLLAGVKKELNSLSSTFSAIQAVLVDAERKQVTKKGLRDWLGKIKEVAYEVEDILDEWRTDAFTSQHDEDEDGIGKIQKVRSCLLFPCLCFKQVNLHHDIGHRIREIRKKLNEISDEKSKFTLEEVKEREVMSGPNKEERETGPFIDESKIFGRDEDKERIINQLVSETSREEKSVSIVSIVGMGGLGKTTLAQLVYNDARVEAYFDKRIWVCVSDTFDFKRIATEVIKSMGMSISNNENFATLQGNLHEAVSNTRFLLVLDDVWNEDDALWEKLSVPLKDAAQGSTVVVTTRSQRVAATMDTPRMNVHELGILSDSDCWEVFNSRALKGTDEENCLELMKIGEKFVERCNGVPLAARAVGSLLRGTREKPYWEHVLDSEIWKWDIANDDIHKNSILPALLLSYYDLPSRLKRCFSFCSVFPKDHVIEKDELVKLWMAHGIIKSVKAKKDNIEEIGEIYFDDLLTRSLFQDAEKDEYGNIVRCKMHDLVHDLATFVTSGEYCSMEAGDSELCSTTCHHLSLLANDDMSSIPSLPCNVKRLHTLLLFGYSYIELVLDTLFNPLRYLRALDLSETSIENLPSFIGKLKHLRYLNLCGLNIVELPESVTNLCNLQTLKLNGCTDLHTLPRSMSKMVKLRHLELEKTTNLTVLPNGLRRLTSLRTLSKFPVGDGSGGCKIGELKELNLLRGKLKIKNLQWIKNLNDASEAELHKKSDLHFLSLCCNDKSDEEWETLVDDEMKRMDSVLEGLKPPHSNLKELKIKNYAGSMFPSWLKLEDSRFSSLVKVVLENCRKCMLLPGLGKLHSLKYLEIIRADEVKVVGCEFYGIVDARGKEPSFQMLEELYFKSMLNWEDWKLKAMPSLKRLEITDCKKLKAIDGWGLLESLHTLTIKDCPELAYLPEGRGQLKVLQTLKFYNCGRLSSLPEGLGQLKALQTLEIWGCGGLSSLPEGLGQLKALQTLNIWGCGGLSSLPVGLGQLKALQTLKILDCRGLSSLPEGLGQLKALQTLQIIGCGGLSSLPEELGQLKALQILNIWGCGGLSSLPEGLGQLKALQTLEILGCGGLSSLPEGLGQLKVLQTLQIECCKGLSSLPEGLGQLKALRTLQIRGCRGLSSLPEGLGQLKALKTLQIEGCEGLSSLPEGLGQLKALRTLKIWGCGGLSSLPEGLGQLKALKTLDIMGYKGLSSLPDGFEQLKSLCNLRIWDCPQLRPLPDLQRLTALQLLSISRCPLLKERLEKEKGEDWCKISHIPCIHIDDRRIN